VIETAAMEMQTEIAIENALAMVDAGIIGVDMIDVATAITASGAGANTNGDAGDTFPAPISIPITATISTAQTLTTTDITTDC
jgi:hypothetical protein